MTTSLPVVSFDTRAARGILEDALILLKELDSYETEIDPDYGAGRERLSRESDKEKRKEIRAHNAELSRDLLRVSARLRLASGEVEELYWKLKGHDDPRGDLVQ